MASFHEHSTGNAAALGTNEMPSFMGPQYNSMKHSAPAFGFGSQERNPNSSARAVGLSPGPIYLPSPRGRMGDGPKATFGTSPCAASPARRAGASPGPGEYETRMSIGQITSAGTSQNAPKYGWGSGGRHQAAIGTSPSPACGEYYELQESIGPQFNSQKRTVGGYSMGTQKRFDLKNKAANPAAMNPGPGAYRTVASTGPQVSSVFRSNPICGFTRDQRFRPPTAAEGGKGYLARSAIAPQVLSERRSKPAYGFGTAKRFGDRPATAVSSTPGPGSYNA
jgi:hypothetical protein